MATQGRQLHGRRFPQRQPLTSRIRTTTAFTIFLSALTLLVSTVLVSATNAPALVPRASSGKIDVSIGKEFSNLPLQLFYLDDSEVVFLQESSTHDIWRSPDEGRTWEKVKDVPNGAAYLVQKHPFAKEVVYILTSKTKHYVSEDKGKSWRSFESPVAPFISGGRPILSFHAGRTDHVIFHGEKCDGTVFFEKCHSVVYYTKDAFRSTMTSILEYAAECMWARSSEHFDSVPETLIYCLDYRDKTGDQRFKLVNDLRMVRTEKFFTESTREVVNLGDGYPTEFGFVEEFLLIAVKSKKAEELELWVTRDGQNFGKTLFPLGDVKREAYTVLESSQYTLTVDIASKPSRSLLTPPYGTLFTSTSDGKHFTKILEHTNRNADGRVDFERVQTKVFDGIMLANVVQNWEDVKNNPFESKKIASKISFNNGQEWRYLQPPEKDSEGKTWSCTPQSVAEESCALHLTSVTQPHNVGRVFSSAGAPGLLVGVGSVGEKLLDYDKSDTFVSSDGGLTWNAAAKGPHKYEILDQGTVIVLLPDDKATNYFLYSTDFGKKFTKKETGLSGFSSWRVKLTEVDEDSTSLKMLAWFTDGSNVNKHALVQISFADFYSRKCSDSDLEKWKPKSSINADHHCVMGHETEYVRRKSGADCYRGEKFKDPATTLRSCPCKKEDFECDYNFDRDSNGKCVPNSQFWDQPEDCPVGTKYQGKSGYRVIPGNKCEGGEDLGASVARECRRKEDNPGGGIGDDDDSGGSSGGTVDPPGGRQPVVKQLNLQDRISKVYYIPKTNIVFMHTEGGVIYRSSNEGQTWEQPKSVKEKGPIERMGLHDTQKERAFFLLQSGEIYWTDDALSEKSSDSFRALKTPEKYNILNIPILDFHPKEPDYLVFVGGGWDCSTTTCHTSTYISTDNGRSWGSPITTWATKCLFVLDTYFDSTNIPSKDAVYCVEYKNKNGKVGQDILGNRNRDDNPLQLVLWSHGGKEKKILIEKGVVNFFVVHNVLVVAVESGGAIKLLVSVDGTNFAETQFPPNMKVEKNAFTMLESTTGGVFMDVLQHDVIGAEYGTLFISNENGTFYSRSLQYTNRGSRGQVDFDKFQGLGGIIIANQVANALQLGKSGVKKQLKSVVSFDDGATWSSLKAPSWDADGHKIECGQDCSLQLFSHTNIPELLGTANLGIHSTPTAPGLFMAVGNVGSRLLDYNEGNVYLTRDGGVSWNEVRKDAHKWAFGDHGGIIVMVNDERPTNTLVYSWNYGKTWASHTFSDKEVRVQSILSEPSSRKFLILGVYSGSGSVEMVVSSVDFATIFERECKSDSSASKSDFENWEMNSDRCFLGKEISWSRRKQDSQCFVGEFKDLDQTVKVCPCTEQDYSCDVHFFRNDKGQCELYGKDPLEPKNCAEGKTFEGSSGYRKIGLSQCQGGKDLTKDKPTRVCGSNKGGGSGTSGGVSTKFHKFEAEMVDYYYFDKSNVVVFRDRELNGWISHDQGDSWSPLNKDMQITQLISDPNQPARLYVLSLEAEYLLTKDSGANWKKMKGPSQPNRLRIPALQIHPTEPDWLIWVGDKSCGLLDTGDCYSIAYYSQDGGSSWNAFNKYVTKCSWAWEGKMRKMDKSAIFCSSYEHKKGDQADMSDTGDSDNPLWLEYTANWGSKWTKVLNRPVGYASVEEFMVIAQARADKAELRLVVSMDGEEWAEAQWPPSFKLPDYGYTVLESKTNRIFLDVNTEVRKNGRDSSPVWGVLFRSNGNGTLFSMALQYTNRDDKGYVDFEKMQGLDGVALANVVENPADVKLGDVKKIRSKITYDDGSNWDYINAPHSDSAGKPYDCAGSKCGLNLHAYTERQDQRDLYSSSSAPGLMVAVGNIGEYLSDYKQGDMFVTRDAGHTWTEVLKDAHMFEFGDHGGIIVMVNNEGPTDSIKYTLDEGKSIEEISISDYVGGDKFTVTNIVTEPAGTTPHFVVFGTVKSSSRTYTAAIHLDFSNAFPRNCAQSDYEEFVPKFATSGCMFGQTVKYWIRKQDANCRIHQEYLPPKEEVKFCACTAADYECDYNYHLDNGKCVLYQGLSKGKPECREDGYLYESTGYRKAPHNKCVGGEVLDNGLRLGSCKGISGFSWFMIISVSLGIPIGVTYGLLRYRKLGGRIRLPTDDLETALGSRDNWRRYAHTAQIYVTAAGQYAAELGELLVDRAKVAYDWIASKVTGRRSQRTGYAALSTDPNGIPQINPFDPTDPNDAALLDLDDDEY
ncbi:hypothetical protein BJ742DRAFT_184196 [Cladochytrium replicatum]|nr:hypothetical protein BJ742DRAFT_184196 [Cladochytrium replicatum]